MHVFGFVGDPLGNAGVEGTCCCCKATPGKTQRQLDRLIEQEWLELPYTMMRLTADTREWRRLRVYWRDRCVQVGNIELNLIRSRSDDGSATYTAVYSRDSHSLDCLRRDLLVPLHPSLEDHQLRWNTPTLCDPENWTSEELAEALLAKFCELRHQWLLSSGDSSPACLGPSPES